nr:unnamed protein product [Drosophila melanogaster]
MPDIPFVLNLDSPDSMYYGHDMFPNRMYRRLHSRQHHDLDLHTLGLIARMGAHAHHLVANKRNGELAALSRGGASNKQGNFEVHLDVGLFQPGELTVKLVNECIVVEGKHEEREDDHGHVSRHFVPAVSAAQGVRFGCHCFHFVGGWSSQYHGSTISFQGGAQGAHHTH